MKNAELRTILMRWRNLPKVEWFLSEQREWVEQWRKEHNRSCDDFLAYLDAHPEEEAMYDDDQIEELLR